MRVFESSPAPNPKGVFPVTISMPVSDLFEFCCDPHQSFVMIAAALFVLSVHYVPARLEHSWREGNVNSVRGIPGREPGLMGQKGACQIAGRYARC